MVADFHDVTENFISNLVKYLGYLRPYYGCGLVNSWRLVASAIYYGHSTGSACVQKFDDKHS